ncbi:AAA family ATPase [Deltaproteobacteria bacterium TL4]
MLTSITLSNFKSYRHAQLPLAALTFLIGPNASGKSNALEAIRLLNWLAKGMRLDDIAKDIQSGDSVVRGLVKDLFLGDDQKFQLGCHVNDAPEEWGDFMVNIGQINEQLVIVGESVTQKDEKIPLYQVDAEPNLHTDEISVAYNNFSKGKNKPHIPCSNRQAIFYQLGTAGRFDSAHQKSQTLIPDVTKIIRETLQNIVVLDPSPALMRGYSYAKDNIIKENGKNLSAVLYSLCELGEDNRQALLAFIRSLPEQDITDIKFIKNERMDVMVRLEETFGHQKNLIDAPLLSDGTLRVLAIGATLLTAPQGALVIIEEIDSGVHPSRAGALVQQIQQIATQRELRVLLTSHNPALLDSLPDNALGDVLCCFRDLEEGDSKLIRLGDLDRYSELVAQGPLGQLMTRRVLERFLKDNTSSEQRQKEAMKWLQQLKQSNGGEQG